MEKLVQVTCLPPWRLHQLVDCLRQAPNERIWEGKVIWNQLTQWCFPMFFWLVILHQHDVMYLLFFCESSAWLQPEELAKSSMISTLKPSVVDLVPYSDSLVLEKSINYSYAVSGLQMTAQELWHTVTKLCGKLLPEMQNLCYELQEHMVCVTCHSKGPVLVSQKSSQ